MDVFCNGNLADMNFAMTGIHWMKICYEEIFANMKIWWFDVIYLVSNTQWQGHSPIDHFFNDMSLIFVGECGLTFLIKFKGLFMQDAFHFVMVMVILLGFLHANRFFLNDQWRLTRSATMSFQQNCFFAARSLNNGIQYIPNQISYTRIWLGVLQVGLGHLGWLASWQYQRFFSVTLIIIVLKHTKLF